MTVALSATAVKPTVSMPVSVENQPTVQHRYDPAFNKAPQDKYALPPVIAPNGEYFGPRNRPVNGHPDEGGWLPGMPYGLKAWEEYFSKRRVQ
jgi:hypothetical protein